MAKILIVYSTTDGHTLEICRRIQQQIERGDNEVTLLSLNDPQVPDLTLYDKIVVGASIRYGKHQQHVYDFVQRHQAILDRKLNAFFSVNVVARKPDRCTPANNPYVKKFLRSIVWQPRAVAVFAGKIDYQMYRFFDRQMIRLIMWITNGPTNLDASVDFTDWSQVDAFGQHVSKM